MLTLLPSTEKPRCNSHLPTGAALAADSFPSDFYMRHSFQSLMTAHVLLQHAELAE